MAAPPRPHNLQKYTLSPAQSLDIFNTEIIPSEFASIPPSPISPPLAILTVGQTGAGKSTLTPSLLSALRIHQHRVPVHFIADTYKTFHPAYASLLEDSPGLASPATSADARKWLAMAASEAVRRRADVVLESACRHPDDFTALAHIFRAAKYRVEVLPLAVPRSLSRLGILVRYVKRLPEAGSKGLPVRWTPTRVHDESYDGLLDVATFLDASHVADQVIVLRRGGLVAYGEERGLREKTGGSVREALIRERERPLSETERNVADEAFTILTSRADMTEQVAEIRVMVDRLSHDASLVIYPQLQDLQFARNEKEDRAIYRLRLGFT